MTATVAVNPTAGVSDLAVTRTATGVDPATPIDTKPVVRAVGEVNQENEPPGVPTASYAPPESPYQGGLIGILMRRARRQADQ